MDLIQLLKDKVSPIVMQNEHAYAVEKQQALGQFYPFLLALLSAKPELITQLKNQLAAPLMALLGHRPELKQDLLQRLNPDIPTGELEDTLNRAIPPSLTLLEQQAGSTEPGVIQRFLQQASHRTLLGLSPGLAAVLSALGVSTASAAQPQTASSTPYHREPESKGFPWWKVLLPLIILGLLLLFLLKACQKDEPVTQHQALATNESAYLFAETDAQGALAQCEIAAGEQSLITNLQVKVQQILNSNVNCREIANGRYSASFIDVDALPSVLGLLKDQPNSKLRWVGDQLDLELGQVADVNAVQTQLQALVPNMKVNVRQNGAADLDEQQAVQNSIAESQQRLTAIDPNNVTALDLATALNLQIINFASASAEIPEENKAVLKQAADLMKKMPNVKLSVNGHTDATGDAQMNKALSLDRAQSVVNYLIGQGVAADQLTAVGYGQERPIADNTTPEGKFKNRRIEFEVYNPETGVTREVTHEGVSEQ